MVELRGGCVNAVLSLVSEVGEEPHITAMRGVFFFLLNSIWLTVTWAFPGGYHGREDLEQSFQM